MPSPFERLRAWLNAEDLAPPTETSNFGSGTEQKLYPWDYGYPGILAPYGMLVHGPGATELIAGGYGRDSNSAVFSCLMALCTAFFEAPLRVYRTNTDGERDWLPNHPMQALLDNPNPAFNPAELWFWVQWAMQTDGNAYLRKIRSGNSETGNVLELWPISPRLITPVTVRDSNDFISFYRRDLGSGQFEDISTTNMVHFKLGVDDRDHRVGLSPLKRLLRQIAADDEVARFMDVLLRNHAVPGTVITTPPDVTITREQAEELKQRIQTAYSGESRGLTGVLTNGATMERMGFSPQELALDGLARLPETRICAVLRVPPAVAGLGVGLEQTSNYASLRVVYEGFTERTLIPLWSLTSAKVDQQLKPDFASDRRIVTGFDLSDVRSLQEDENERFKRLQLATGKAWMTVNEARAEIGLAPIEGGDELNKPLPLPGQVDDGEEDETDGDTPPSLQVVKMLAERKAIQLDDLPTVYLAMLELASPGFSRDIERYFDRQRRTVKRRLVSGGG